MKNPVSRRSLLKQSMVLGSGITLAGPLENLYAKSRHSWGPNSRSRGYGDLHPTLDDTTGLPLLKLPRGFHYASFGWTGDIMSDGTLTPDRHDGMAVVNPSTSSWPFRSSWRGGNNDVVLIRNHERGVSDPDSPLPLIGAGKAPVYDDFTVPGVVSGLGGGTTSLVVHNGQLLSSQATLAGTLTNCAGGPTPWGTWLTCEETTIRGSLIGARDHGYVFEVPDPAVAGASANPIVDMGFFDHEACAVDARTGTVYLTEDNGPYSGFYRFHPNDRSGRIGSLERGGRLEMLAVKGASNADLRSPEQGDVYEVSWVPIDDPNADPETYNSPGDGFPPIEGSGRSGCYFQGEAQGAARFARGEGCWYQNGIVYWIDTSGGAAGKGVVWAYVEFFNRAYLYAVFVSPGDEIADNPDNITLSPRGGILVCEDGGGSVVDDELQFGSRLVGIDLKGDSFHFAENNLLLDAMLPGNPYVQPGDYRTSEFAGACFDSRGDWLYVNIQTPGVTFAIRGPWGKGLL